MNLKGKRVLIYLDGLEMGGAERQALHIADKLIDEGANVEVWGLGGEGIVAKILTEKKINWKVIPIKNYFHRYKILFDCLRVVKHVRQFKPDIILPFTHRPNVIMSLIWRFTSAKMCAWNQRDEGRGFKNRLLENLALKLSSHVISNSIEGKEYLAQFQKISENKIQIINNGIEMKPKKNTREEWRNKLGLNPQDFVVVMIANLHKYKDHKTLLKAWQFFLNNTKKRETLTLYYCLPG
jgi:glycosyltransferase involved in cell wall biosynthesis